MYTCNITAYCKVYKLLKIALHFEETALSMSCDIIGQLLLSVTFKVVYDDTCMWVSVCECRLSVI